MSVPSHKQEILVQAYDAYADALFRFCLVKLSARERSLDVVQEVFLRLWRYLLEDKEISNMKSFLFTTARNLIIDEYRKKKFESLDKMTEEGFDIDGGDDIPLLSVDSEKALKALQSLDPLYREIMILRYVNSLSPKEIAIITGLSENVVSVRIHRALEKLRDDLNIHE